MKKLKTLDEIKTTYYGPIGTAKRDELESELASLRVGLKIREAREKQNMTQEQLAQRINKKRAYISKLENDGENLTLKTLFEVVERGLGGKLNIEVSV